MKDYIVYKHTSPSNKVYIGITCQSINERFRKGKGYRDNQAFYKAIQKYGWDNIKHEILFTNLTKEEACEKEIELIKLHKSNNSKFGYNIASGGGVNKDFHLSEETKRLISKRNSGCNNGMYGKRFKQSQEALNRFREHVKTRNYNGSNNPKAKQINQIDLENNVVKVWDCIKNASAYLGISYSYLIQIIKTQKEYKGYKWSYVKGGGENHGKRK